MALCALAMCVLAALVLFEKENKNLAEDSLHFIKLSYSFLCPCWKKGGQKPGSLALETDFEVLICVRKSEPLPIFVKTRRFLIIVYSTLPI